MRIVILVITPFVLLFFFGAILQSLKTVRNLTARPKVSSSASLPQPARAPPKTNGGEALYDFDLLRQVWSATEPRWTFEKRDRAGSFVRKPREGDVTYYCVQAPLVCYVRNKSVVGLRLEILFGDERMVWDLDTTLKRLEKTFIVTNPDRFSEWVVDNLQQSPSRGSFVDKTKEISGGVVLVRLFGPEPKAPTGYKEGKMDLYLLTRSFKTEMAAVPKS